MSCYDSKQEILPCVHCATKPPGYDGTCIRVCPGIITTVEAKEAELIIGFIWSTIQNLSLVIVVINNVINRFNQSH